MLHITTSEEIETNHTDAEGSVDTEPGIQLAVNIQRHSRLTKLLRVTGYVLRFIHNVRHPSQKVTGPLTPKGLHYVQRLWIGAVQRETFAKEYAAFKSKTPTRLLLVCQLRLFPNKDSLIYCGGRIYNAPVSDSTKFPCLLPRRHPLTELIVCDTHERHFHSGTNSTVTYL